MYSAPKMQNGGTIVVVKRNFRVVFGRREVHESKNDHDIPILAAVATYMSRNLHQNQGFYESKMFAAIYD